MNVKPLSIGFYLDTRFPMKRHPGKFAVKLRVHSHEDQKQRLFTLKTYASKDDYEKASDLSISTGKLPDEVIRLRILMNEARKKAMHLASKPNIITVNQFSEAWKGKKVSTDLFEVLEEIKADLTKLKKYGSASVTGFAIKRIKKVHGKSTLSIYDITPMWCKQYEVDSIGKYENSNSTVGFDMREIRKALNKVINSKMTPYTNDHYPFGGNGYTIKQSKSIKIALKPFELEKFWNWTPTQENYQIAKDYFFAMFLCNGLNPQDLLSLTHDDIKEDRIEFIRKKSKEQNVVTKVIKVHLSPEILGIFDRNIGDGKYVWDCCRENKSEFENSELMANYRSRMNKLLKRVAKKIGINKPLHGAMARSSFATRALTQDANIVHISNMMGHSSIKVTQGYFASFAEDEQQKEISEKLLSFDDE
jgi:integrase